MHFDVRHHIHLHVFMKTKKKMFFITPPHTYIICKSRKHQSLKWIRYDMFKLVHRAFF